MNRIYKVIFNKAKGLYEVVGELVHSHSKPKSSCLSKAFAAALICCGIGLTSNPFVQATTVEAPFDLTKDHTLVVQYSAGGQAGGGGGAEGGDPITTVPSSETDIIYYAENHKKGDLKEHHNAYGGGFNHHKAWDEYWQYDTVAGHVYYVSTTGNTADKVVDLGDWQAVLTNGSSGLSDKQLEQVKEAIKECRR